MNLLLDELVCVLKEFGGDDNNGCGSITNFLVLELSKFNKNPKSKFNKMR